MDLNEDAVVKAGDLPAAPEEHVPAEEHRKKHISKGGKAALSIVIILFLLIVLPISLIVGLLYDNRVYFTPDKNFDKEKAVSDLIYDSIENTSDEDPAIRFAMDENTVNNLIYDYLKPYAAKAKGLIDSVVVDIDGVNKQYHVIVGAGVPYFRTRAYLDLDVNEEYTDDTHGDCYEFKITNARLGHIGHCLPFAKWLAGILKFNIDGQISQIADDYVHILPEINDEDRLLYNKMDAVQDVTALINEDEKSLFGEFLKGSTEMDIAHLDFLAHDKLGGTIDLEGTDLRGNPFTTKTNHLYCSDEKRMIQTRPKVIDNPKAASDKDFGVIQVLEHFFNEWQITPYEADVADGLMDYLVRGADLYTLGYKYELSGLFENEEVCRTANVPRFYAWWQVSDWAKDSYHDNNGDGRIDYLDYRGVGLPAPTPAGADTLLQDKLSNLITNELLPMAAAAMSSPSGTHVKKTGTFGGTGPSLAKINEDDINKELKNAEVIGYTSLYSKEDHDQHGEITHRHYNFATVDNLYFNIQDGMASAVISLSINGRQYSLCVPAKEDAAASGYGKAVFKVGNTYSGDKVNGPTMHDELVSLAKRGFKNFNWVDYDEMSSRLIMDFNPLIQGALAKFMAAGASHSPAIPNSLIQKMINSLNVTLVCRGVSKDALGILDFDYTLDFTV